MKINIYKQIFLSYTLHLLFFPSYLMGKKKVFILVIILVVIVAVLIFVKKDGINLLSSVIYGSNGTSAKKVYCTDSDGGINFPVAGTISAVLSPTYSLIQVHDECLSAKVLREWHCENVALGT